MVAIYSEMVTKKGLGHKNNKTFQKYLFGWYYFKNKVNFEISRLQGVLRHGRFDVAIRYASFIKCNTSIVEVIW